MSVEDHETFCYDYTRDRILLDKEYVYNSTFFIIMASDIQDCGLEFMTEWYF